MSAAVAETLPMDVDQVQIGEEEEEEEEEEQKQSQEESNATAAVVPKQSPSSSKSNKDKDQSVLYSPELLKMYYSRLFPYSFLYDWLSYGGSSTDLFNRREFSFTLEPVKGTEIYIRYQSFGNKEDLQAEILKRRPSKIDIGAVFSHSPKDAKTLPKGALKPVERELVFDIDLTDYDGLRRCGCSGASICSICWGYMKMAVKVMDAGLKEDFGFAHVAWFYSGRRGIHAWVCDEAARALTDAERSSVANYFDVNVGSDKNKDVYMPLPLHPMLQRAFEVLEPLFIEQVLPSKGHGYLATAEKWDELLQDLPETIREKTTSKWSSVKCHSTPAEKWDELQQHIRAYLEVNKKGSGKSAKHVSSKELEKVEQWKYLTVFRHTYPKLDINVSKMRNHLLKSPFCVHPKTGRVCVPIQAHKIDSFDPFAVPTLGQLMDELDAFDKENDNEKSRAIQNWKKTSLKGYFEPFVKEFLDPLQKGIRRQERDNAERQAAVSGDF